VSATDRERIADLLLEDEKRSFRSIGRELGVSDWLVRRVARELDDDPRPMRRPRSSAPETDDDGSPIASLITVGIIAGLFALAIWARARWGPFDA
jgi:hypothetical protein